MNNNGQPLITKSQRHMEKSGQGRCYGVATTPHDLLDGMSAYMNVEVIYNVLSLAVVPEHSAALPPEPTFYRNQSALYVACLSSSSRAHARILMIL